MNKAAAQENKMTLQSLLGQTEQSSEKILGSKILLTVTGNHTRLAEFLSTILSKTFEEVHLSPEAGYKYDCEVVTDSDYKVTSGPHVFLKQKLPGWVSVSVSAGDKLSEDLHPFIYFLLGCYSGAITLKQIINELPFKVDDEISIEVDKFINDDLLGQTIRIDKAYLAGAGAIGNSFLYALTTFGSQIEGEMDVVDPDFISGGNLNRCLLFTEDDIEDEKAPTLVARVKPYFPKMELNAVTSVLASHPDNNGKDWLKKLVVCVDSRRARRSLQDEIPREVYDASTTGIVEVVLHRHVRPLEGACLSCIYVKENEENAHEKHIAEALGVQLNHIHQQFITEEAAGLMAQKFSIEKTDILGLPYDTLFKQLCGEGKLPMNNSKNVLAPLAFCSALAGALLAHIFVMNHISQLSFNYWKASPWANLNYRLQQFLDTNAKCPCCNNQIFKRTATALWGTST